MALITTGQFALIFRMRVLLNRIRSSERQIGRMERRELTDAEKGDIDRIKADFKTEMEALHREDEKLRALYHDEALLIMRNIDSHIEKAINFITDLEKKGLPPEHAKALADMLDEQIKDLIAKLGVTEDELERVRAYITELESEAGRARKKAA